MKNTMVKYKILLDTTLLKPWNEFFTSLYWYMKFPKARIAFSEWPSERLKVEVGDNSYSPLIRLLPNSGRNIVKIGSGCHIAVDTTLILTKGHMKGNPSIGIDEPECFVEIGNNVWIGVGVDVMPNIRIGHGATIGAGSVVTRDVADHDVVAGVPARSIKKSMKEGDRAQGAKRSG
jgi:acetyltransferase-like isoleucine patch superfamily enzyme